MTISLLDLIGGTGALAAVSIGFTYHLGWKHGWAEGFRIGGRNEVVEKHDVQPAAKNVISFIYVLGWHHGWDYGFRKGDQLGQKR